MTDRTGTTQPIGTLLSPRAEAIVIAWKSGAAITVGRCVQITASGNVSQVAAAVTRASKPLAGIAMQGATAASVKIEVCMHGEIIAEAGGAITVGAWVGSNTSGQVVALTLGTAAGATTVTADADDATVEGYAGIGICTRQNGTSAAGDGVGVMVK